MRDKYFQYDRQNLPHPLLYQQNAFKFIEIPPNLCHVDNFDLDSGVARVYVASNEIALGVISLEQFYADLLWILKYMNTGFFKSFCYKRLKFLEKKFELHMMYNKD